MRAGDLADGADLGPAARAEQGREHRIGEDAQRLARDLRLGGRIEIVNRARQEAATRLRPPLRRQLR